MELHNLGMPTVEEKAAFADRLKLALRRVPEKPDGPTEVAPGISTCAITESQYPRKPVDKWLKGRTIPKHDKLETLATALGVDLHWLHYGPSSAGATKAKHKKPLAREEKYPLSPESLELATKIESLTPHHRYLVQELIAQFYDEVEED